MPRSRRIDFEGAIHHVMNRGVDRQTVFFDDVDRIDFGHRLNTIHDELGVRTLAYCLMGNHYHLLLHTPTAGLSDAMHHVGSVFTRHANDRHGRDGPLFRGRFHSIVVSTDRYLGWVTRYIHRNPLELTSVTSPSEFRWSSYRSYLELRPTPPFLDTSIVLGLFGGDPLALAAFTEDTEVRNDAIDSLTPDDLIQMVQFAVANDDIGFGSAVTEGRNARVRTVLTLLAGNQAIRPIATVATDLVAAPTSTAMRMALSRARRRRADDPSIDRILATVVNALVPSRRTAA